MDDMTFRNGHPPPVDPPRSPPHTPDMDNERLVKLEGAYDSLKVVRPMTLAVVGIFLAAQVFVLGFLTTQVHDLNAKVDAIPAQLRDEFRAMRAEMAAQTSAIANSITATRQVQPQILVMPPPPPAPAK
jgi:hypothetical protein